MTGNDDLMAILVKLDERSINQSKSIKRIEQQLRETDALLDDRLRKVEKEQAGLTAKVAGLCALLTAAISTFLNSIIGKL